ncbi:MAG TPA: hypothetical protein G4O03_00440 [Dehalococcoidia bacterium]|nr:hypothetical protein [Dehalococcoidia bacterium]
MALGSGRQTRKDPQMLVPSKGFMRQIDVVECIVCRKSWLNKLLRIGPYRDWYDGHTAKEKHWHIDKSDPRKTIGLRLGCFYSVYMELLGQARLAYRGRWGVTESSLAKNGRAALVSVSVNNILSVESEGHATAAIETELGIGSGITLKVSKLKVMDLIDQLPLVLSESFLDAILDAPVEWHHRWHQLVDSIQPESWRDFPARMAATLELASR